MNNNENEPIDNALDHDGKPESLAEALRKYKEQSGIGSHVCLRMTDWGPENQILDRTFG